MHFSNVTHLPGIDYTAVDLSAILSPLNRKSISHFPTLIFVSLMLSLAFCVLSLTLFVFGPILILAHSCAAVFLCTCLQAILSVLHCVWLPFPLNWVVLTSVYLPASLFSLWSPWVLSLVAMVIQRVKWCWVMLWVSPGLSLEGERFVRHRM